MLSSLADRLSARPRRVLLAVLAFVALAGVVGGPVAGALEDEGGFLPADAPAEQARERLERATGTQAAPGVVLLAPADRLDRLAAELATEPGVADARAVPGEPPFVAGTLRADADDGAVAEAVLERFGDRAGVQVGGGAVAQHQISERISEDLTRAETLALPLLLLLSLVFFRGRAALMPLAVGITTVLGTFLALTAVNQVYGLSIFALNLVIGLGLGLAIDYTLFLVTRFREELERTGVGPQAIRATMETAGRTVLFSAATVAAALITLTVFPLGFLQSMGLAGAVVSVVAGLSALVLAPPLFAVWGARLARPSAVAGSGRWYRLSHAVMRRPGAVAGVTAVLMVVLMAPSLRTVWTPVDASVIPKDLSARAVAEALPQTAPLSVAIEAGAEDAGAVRAFAQRVAQLDGAQDVAAPVALDGRTWQLDVRPAGTPEGETAQELVRDVRALPAPFAAEVTGPAAEFVDQQAGIGSRLALALVLLTGLTFAVLWLMTGSVVLPLKAIVMNALTVGSALGVLTLIYQDGRFESLLGYTANGGIEPSDFLVTAALVFALSTDYGVFLLGRIKEARDAGLPEREAVAVGLERTGGVVTAAAILLAVAIGAFSTSSISFIQQIGVATAVGVLLDAFVVRTFLVPALMALLGRWNWWSPMRLRRLHDRLGLREGELAHARA
jgi:uncharacterized membrane protein YdfJ with MMPL/SSD domain